MASNVYGPRAIPKMSEEEALAAFDSVPLFMKSLPEEQGEGGALSALQSLIYDGTPDEIAENFKDQGNEYFKGKRFREALGFYTQGLDARPEDKGILEALLCNRAACNLALRNYGSVLRDCSAALNLNPKSSKAYYRSALALVALERFEDALDCCARCLAYDPDNDGVKMAQKNSLKLKAEADLKLEQKMERLRLEEERKLSSRDAYQARNLVILSKPDGSANPVAPHFDKEDPFGKTMVFPVFFLYPQYATSDVISEFVEDTTFVEHIETMFPPGAPAPLWDQKREYTTGNLVVYATTHRKRLFKVGRKMSLWDVFAASKAKEGQPRDGLELKDGCLSFVLMPRGDVETKWVEEFKNTRNG